ncbi:MAG: hypothetical protein AB8F74_02520 [Saprospiraceae bacterium]
MKPQTANLINALALMAMGLWGYFSTGSNTAFISVGFGVALLLCQNGVRKDNKVVAHIAVVLTLVVLLAYFGMRLPKALNGDTIALVRAIIPIITGVLAMVAFIQSFIAARKARENAS